MNQDSLTYKWAGRTLQFGMYLSFACMVAGLIWWLIAGAPGGSASARVSVPVDRLWPELFQGNSLALLNVGVVLLLITPAATLMTTILTFGMERNWRFTGIASLVGSVLLLSLAISLGWFSL